MRKTSPMHAMKLDHHVKKALNENDFTKVSDKVREQLVEKGMPPREAAMKAPVILDGVDKALQGEFDFKRIRCELKAEREQDDAAGQVAPA